VGMIRRYKVRFYRLKEKPDDKASWYELEILGHDDIDVAWKIQNVIKNNEVMGARTYKTKVLGYTEEPEKEKRKRW